jgi:DNA-binding Xre family transcriptional regulator
VRTKTKVGYRWHLRMRMAERGMFATSDLVPLLAERGVTLSREQVYRLVAGIPERLSLQTLAALCDILDCGPGDLIEPTRETPPPKTKATGANQALATLRPRRAEVASGPKR